MESGLPMLNCLLQHALRSLCLSSVPCNSSSSSSSSKWVYAIFWRIIPRNFPPPKWEFGGSALDRTKGNKRNWILVWEDGFCDFLECERAGSGCIRGRFGVDFFFKMSHEVYSYGEGLVGKTAADNSHKWVFRENPTESDPNLISSWNSTIEPQPRAWESQFKSGIQTIAVIAVREGIIQLGSFDKVAEDLNLVINIQRKFSYLQSMPGVFAVQRPYLPSQHPYILKPNVKMIENQSTGVKRLLNSMTDDSSIKSINLGWNAPQQHCIASGSIPWSIPPILPSTSSSPRAFEWKFLSNIQSYEADHDHADTVLLIDNDNNNNKSQIIVNIPPHSEVKMETSCELVAGEEAEAEEEEEEEKASCMKTSMGLFEDEVVREIGFRLSRKGETSQK